MKPTKQQLTDAFVHAESKLDYDKVLGFMILTKWTWRGDTPTKQQLKDTVQQLFGTLCELDTSKSTRVSTGGFIVQLWQWEGSIEIEIMFTCTRYSTQVEVG